MFSRFFLLGCALFTYFLWRGGAADPAGHLPPAQNTFPPLKDPDLSLTETDFPGRKAFGLCRKTCRMAQDEIQTAQDGKFSSTKTVSGSMDTVLGITGAVLGRRTGGNWPGKASRARRESQRSFRGGV